MTEKQKEHKRQYDKEYYQRNKERTLKKTKERHRLYNQRAEIKEHKRLYRKTPKGMLTTYRHGAKQRNILFELELSDFEALETNLCSYCGNTENLGYDRVDNSVGYIKENITPCCGKCNKNVSNKLLDAGGLVKTYMNHHNIAGPSSFDTAKGLNLFDDMILIEADL